MIHISTYLKFRILLKLVLLDVKKLHTFLFESLFKILVFSHTCAANTCVCDSDNPPEYFCVLVKYSSPIMR